MIRMIAGVDEAGRGPVIGPLIIGVFACHASEEKKLKRWGVKDSKLLSDSKREALAEKLAGYPHVLVEVSAEEITRFMRNKTSLNDVEAIKVAEALEKLYKKQEVERVFVDSPDSVPKKFEHRIRKHLSFKLKGVEIVSENKADVKYVVAGAASILAKSQREKRVLELQEMFGEEMGSGYPSDGRTISFLKKHGGDKRLKKHIRWEWDTVKRLKLTEVKLSEFF
ncbi:ribonuclease HII [Candidatus Micrarchaeota archaeon]|nr:ribonuclease HII [Candidatus Micrarchaeota archaeon]